MASFHAVRAALDRILGDASPGNHGAFWHGKTRDEFVRHIVFGLPIIEVGQPRRSNIVRALRGEAPFGSDLNPPTPGAFIPRMPARRPAGAEEDILLIEGWITAGCPDYDAGAAAIAGLAAPPSDDDHMGYWRDVDAFFLPSLASAETSAHVNRLHVLAFGAWHASNIGGDSADIWETYRSQADVVTSFNYIRLHQRRLILDYYGPQDDVFDSLWKFGGDLLPRDPQSKVLPEHRMNSTLDWFFWVPYVEISLRADDKTDVDLALARAWQVGIAADGLLRTDDERPQRIPIPDFDENDPDLKGRVMAAYSDVDPAALIDGMLTRAKDFFIG